MRCETAVLAGLVFVVLTSTATAGPFAGPAFIGGSTDSSAWQIDMSQLNLIDLTDGFKLSGTVTATYIADPLSGFSGPFGSVLAIRRLAVTTATPIAHIDATLTNFGDVAFSGLQNRTGVTLAPSDVYCNTDTAVSDITTILGGNGFYSGPTDVGSECSNTINDLYLFQTLTFDATVFGQGRGASVVFNLGNSSTSEATTPSAVPEPTTSLYLGFAAGILALTHRRCMSTPRQRDNS
jgi:hypothetical protein